MKQEKIISEVEAYQLHKERVDRHGRWAIIGFLLVTTYLAAFSAGTQAGRGGVISALDERAKRLEDQARAALDDRKPDELQAWMYAAQARHIRLLRHDIFEDKFASIWKDWPDYPSEPQFGLKELPAYLATVTSRR